MEKHQIKQNAASAAVVALRKRMGKSQQAFASEVLKMAISTVGRYENSLPPSGEMLLRLATIANSAGFSDLAQEFRFLYAREAKELLHCDMMLRPPTETQPVRGFVVMEFEGQDEYEATTDYLKRLAEGRKERKDHEK